MRIRFSKKGLIAAGIAGSVLLCGAIFKITTDNGIIKNHEVAHVGTGHSVISDAVVAALEGDGAEEVTKETAAPGAQIDANVDAAALAGVTMSAEVTDAQATAQTQDKPAEQTTPQAPAVEEKKDEVADVTEVHSEEAPVQEEVYVPVQEAEPVVEMVEVTKTRTVRIPVTQTQEAVRQVATNVNKEEPVVLPEKEGRSFAGEVGGSLDSGVEDAKARIIENSTPGGGVEGDKTGEDVFIVFE